MVAKKVIIDGSLGGGRNDSPGPNNYEPDRGMRIIKESSPEWTYAIKLSIKHAL